MNNLPQGKYLGELPPGTYEVYADGAMNTDTRVFYAFKERPDSHTKPPYRTTKIKGEVRDNKGFVVADCQKQADADFIVHCVNAHPALYNRLEHFVQLLNAVDTDGIYREDFEVAHRVLNNARFKK